MKKNSNSGFFLSETMVVLSIVIVVLLGVFKLFSSVYYGFKESESYNTQNAINALSNVQKYYESIGNIDISELGESNSFIELTDLEKYESEYYTRLKDEYNIAEIYLIDLNYYFLDTSKNKFYVTLKQFMNTLKNVQGIALVIVLDSSEFAYSMLDTSLNVELVGNKEDEYAVYVNIGDEFVDPGYINWNGDEPVITWENDVEIDTSNPGTYYMYYDFDGTLFRRKVVVGDYVNEYSYTGSYQTFMARQDGYYKVELWGAQGGGATYGGKGAYTSGLLKMKKGEEFYLYIGGEGPSTENVTNIGGYNGGGYSGNNSGANSYGGGGATDIRLVNGEWNNELGLNSRIMVAAGGAGTTSSLTSYAGVGGTLVGGNGTSSLDAYNTSEYLPTGSGQITYGFAYGDTVRSGSFGYGIQTNSSGFGGGGGGGYYAGNTGHGTTGSGGSSFISGYAGVNAINSSTDTANPRTHSNNTLHYSNKYFIDGQMQAGINEGNGKATITYVGNNISKTNTKFNNVRYIKDCISGNSVNNTNHYLELQAISNGKNVAYGKTVSSTEEVYISDVDTHLELPALVDSNISTLPYIVFSSENVCVTVDLEGEYNLDEIAVWHYYKDGRSYNDHSLYVSSDNENWTTLIDNVSGVVETSNGIRVSAYD